MPLLEPDEFPSFDRQVLLRAAAVTSQVQFTLAGAVADFNNAYMFLDANGTAYPSPNSERVIRQMSAIRMVAYTRYNVLTPTQPGFNIAPWLETLIPGDALSFLYPATTGAQLQADFQVNFPGVGLAEPINGLATYHIPLVSVPGTQDYFTAGKTDPVNFHVGLGLRLPHFPNAENVSQRVWAELSDVRSFLEEDVATDGTGPDTNTLNVRRTRTYRIRYRSDIYPGAIVHDGEVWRVVGADEEGRKQILRLECEQVDVLLGSGA